MLKKNPLAVVLGLSVLFFVIFMAVAVGTVLTLTPGGRTSKKLFAKANNIGVIEIKGVISDSKKVLEQIEDFGEDEKVKGVILRVNSPGGAVAPSQEIYDALKGLGKKKPVYTSMASLAASGGYYVACGTKKIFASPGTITGSIGVIMHFANVAKLMEWAKVSSLNVKTGKYKDIGSPNREMTVEEKALIQDMIDNVLGQFRKAVASARGLTMDKVIEVSDGRIFSGEQAKDAKLVDELGGMHEAVEALAKEAGIQGKPNLVYGSKKKRGFEKIFGELDDDDASSSVSGDALSAVARALLGFAGDRAAGVVEGAASGLGNTAGPMFLAPLFGR